MTLFVFLWSYLREIFYSIATVKIRVLETMQMLWRQSLCFLHLFLVSEWYKLGTHWMSFLILWRGRKAQWFFPANVLLVLILRAGSGVFSGGPEIAGDSKNDCEHCLAAGTAGRQLAFSISLSSPETTLISHEWQEFSTAPIPVKNCWRSAVVCSHNRLQRIYGYDRTAELAVITFISWARTHQQAQCKFQNHEKFRSLFIPHC